MSFKESVEKIQRIELSALEVLEKHMQSIDEVVSKDAAKAILANVDKIMMRGKYDEQLNALEAQQAEKDLLIANLQMELEREKDAASKLRKILEGRQ